MGSVTGIEIGHDSGVLVAVRPRRGGPTQVRAFQIVEGADWPSHDTALAAVFRLVRRTRKLPRRARVVSWALPDGANPRDPVAAAVLRPLTAAGFRVECVLSPPQALAALAASQRRVEATAWLALNVQGAAIAVVRGGALLFSRTFEWTYKTDVVGTRAQLLQRYSLVAQLAPELRRGIATVRLEHDETITTVITCGDLPELRSLTMPLIEELDLEVETLDSTDGLEAVGKARMERFAESAPALRLACAAGEIALRPGRFVLPAWPRVAAAAVILAALGAGALALRNRQAQTARPPRPAATASKPATTGTPVPSTAPAARPGTAVGSATAPAAAPVSGSAAAPGSATASVPPPPGAPATASAGRPGATGATPVPRAPVPAAPVAQRPAVPAAAGSAPSASVKSGAPPPAVAPAILPPPGAASRNTVPSSPAPSPPPAMRAPGPALPGPPPVRQPSSSVPGRTPARSAPPTTVEPSSKPSSAAPLRPAASSTPPPDVEPSPKPSSPASGRPAARAVRPLTAPLPKVDSVLIDQQRRLAIVDGAVVSVGDTLGPRVVVAINRDGIVLREASGHEVRVPLRPAFGR